MTNRNEASVFLKGGLVMGALAAPRGPSYRQIEIAVNVYHIPGLADHSVSVLAVKVSEARTLSFGVRNLTKRFETGSA